MFPAALPVARSRADAFDELVLAAVEEVAPRLGNRLDEVEFAVEDIPPAAVIGQLAPGEPVPLGSWAAGEGRGPAKVVVYRRPVELRAGTDLAELLSIVVVEQLAGLFGIPPEQIDPDLDE